MYTPPSSQLKRCSLKRILAIHHLPAGDPRFKSSCSGVGDLLTNKQRRTIKITPSTDEPPNKILRLTLVIATLRRRQEDYFKLEAILGYGVMSGKAVTE